MTTTIMPPSFFQTPKLTPDPSSNLSQKGTLTPSSTNMFTSPTESEFSESFREGPGSVQNWDETQVIEWLISIQCGQYAELFRRNNINGENLLDIDQSTLKEMGVKRIGDRVRIGAQAKAFRNTANKRVRKRDLNRQSIASLHNSQYKSQDAAQPPVPHPLRIHQNRIGDGDLSHQQSGGDTGLPVHLYRSSRPNSPFVDQENSALRLPRVNVKGTVDVLRSDQNTSYASKDALDVPRHIVGLKGTGTAETPQTARFAHHIRASPSADNLSAASIGSLPSDKSLIRVIYENGRHSVINVDGFRSAEDVIRMTLRKGNLNENHCRSYCFYVLDGTDPRPDFCRRLGDTELVKLCNDRVRNERGRLMLRKIHTAEPEGEQLQAAARIAEQQLPEPPAIEVQSTGHKGALKLEKFTGEPLAPVSYPMSPASEAERRDYFNAQTLAISRNASHASSASSRARKLKDFYGARPPTELISQDLQSYFPEVAKEEMDRTVRMSIRRSQRLSRAMSRLSTVSSFSVASVMRDAPPMPTIADHWMKEPPQMKAGSLRAHDALRFAHTDAYRESMISTLAPLDEESMEPDRKSYVSFSGASSDSDTTNIGSTMQAGSDGHGSSTYFDESSSLTADTDLGSNTINSRLSQFIAEDGEEDDVELMQHLERDNWDDIKYMKGEMIGQGSFGTVFLALHAVTAELMAVKQVEITGNGTGAKNEKMVEALKHEISLLRDLKHPNIVQYLGSNSEERTLNIFLEYVAGGSVATMLVNYGHLPEGLISNFVRQILQGLTYLHSKDIIHRDIKGANILVDNKGTVKISDFGISKRVEASTMLHPQPLGLKRGGPRVSLQGSVFWMAPEVVRQTAYTKKADIWSLGCLVVEMFTGSHPHPNCTQLQAIFKIGGAGSNAENARPDLPETASEHAKDFLRHTFEIEHEKRPSAEELATYPFCALKA